MATTTRKTDRKETTKEEREAIVHIAKRHGIHYAAKAFRRPVMTVYYLCYKAGVRWKKTAKITPMAQRRKCVALAVSGKYTYNQLAEMFGVCRQCVAYWVRTLAK